MARRDAKGVRLISRNGNDLTSHFPLLQGEQKRPLTPEEQERQKQLDDSYKAAAKKIPEQKANDPWANVRPTPTAPAPRKKQQ